MSREVRIVFGNALRKLRKKHSLSRENLASKVGLTIEDIALMESGQHSPSLEMMFALCSIFKISLIDLASKIEEKR